MVETTRLSKLLPSQKFHFSSKLCPNSPEFTFMGRAFSEFTKDGNELFRVLLPSVNASFLVIDSVVVIGAESQVDAIWASVL